MKNLRSQRGMAIVEHTLTIVVFLLVVMAIMEFSLLMFYWARAAEASRYAGRLAIVSDPIVSVDSLDCPDGTITTINADCGSSSACEDILNQIHSFIPNIEAENIQISYSCSGAGFESRPEELLIPQVTVKLTDLQYRLVVPGLLGLPAVWRLPTMTSTRTGEDMETVATL